jgi:hypothetical protein
VNFGFSCSSFPFFFFPPCLPASLFKNLVLHPASAGIRHGDAASEHAKRP